MKSPDVHATIHKTNINKTKKHIPEN